jgi:stage V sporulation protein G
VQITDVRVRKVSSPEGKVKANCSVVFDEMFVVHDVRIVEGVNGVFVAMPRRKTADGEYRDLAHPITAEARALIQKAVLDAYNEAEQHDPLSA